MATFKSNVEDIVLNADGALGDVYLVSRDRKYFLAHRIVLVLYLLDVVVNRKLDINYKKLNLLQRLQ
jgi:hypothetical protein